MSQKDSKEKSTSAPLLIFSTMCGSNSVGVSIWTMVFVAGGVPRLRYFAVVAATMTGVGAWLMTARRLRSGFLGWLGTLRGGNAAAARALEKCKRRAARIAVSRPAVTYGSSEAHNDIVTRLRGN